MDTTGCGYGEKGMDGVGSVGEKNMVQSTVLHWMDDNRDDNDEGLNRVWGDDNNLNNGWVTMEEEKDDGGQDSVKGSSVPQLGGRVQSMFCHSLLPRG